MINEFTNENRILVSINGLDLIRDEIVKVEVHTQIGNVMPWAELWVNTSRELVHANCQYEMSKVEIEMQQLGRNNAVVESKKMKFFLSKVDNLKNSTSGNNTTYSVKLKLVGDAEKYMSIPEVRAAEDRETNLPKFISGMICIGVGCGRLQLEIKDNLLSRATDWQNWIQFNLTGMQFVNMALSKAMIETSDNEDEGNKREYVYTSAIDFAGDGNPKISLYDLKLRTQTFPPATVKTLSEGGDPTTKQLNFSYKSGDSRMMYQSPSLNIKGAEHSKDFNGRTASIYDTEEHSYNSKEIKQPMLFSDSQEYTEAEEFDGTSMGNLPKTFPAYKSKERGQGEIYTSNHSNMNQNAQKFQTSAAIQALKKVTYGMAFPNQMIDVKPISMCTVEVPKPGEDGGNPVDDTRLTGKYMVLEVDHVYVGGRMNTYVTAGRDSFVA